MNKEKQKSERQSLYPILTELQVDKKSLKQLSQLMHFLGYEDDVQYARSIFADKIIEIYKYFQGKYQKYLSLDRIMQLSQENRQFLFTIFNKYHEIKIIKRHQVISPKNVEKNSKQASNNKRIEGSKQRISQNLIKIPELKVQQIEEFQRKMYSIYKDVMPQLFQQMPEQSVYIPQSMPYQNNYAAQNCHPKVTSIGMMNPYMQFNPYSNISTSSYQNLAFQSNPFYRAYSDKSAQRPNQNPNSHDELKKKVKLNSETNQDSLNNNPYRGFAKVVEQENEDQEIRKIQRIDQGNFEAEKRKKIPQTMKIEGNIEQRRGKSAESSDSSDSDEQDRQDRQDGDISDEQNESEDEYFSQEGSEISQISSEHEAERKK